MANATWQKRTGVQWDTGHPGGHEDKGGWVTGCGAGPGGMPRRGVAVRQGMDKPHMTGIPSFTGMDEPATIKYTCDPASVYNAKPASIYKFLPTIPGVLAFRIRASSAKTKSPYGTKGATSTRRKKPLPEQVAKAMLEEGKVLSSEERSLVSQIEAYQAAIAGGVTPSAPYGGAAKKDVAAAAATHLRHLRNLRKALSMWQGGLQVEQVADATRSARQLTAGVLSNKAGSKVKDGLHTPHRKVGQLIVKTLMSDTRQLFGQVMGDVRHMFSAFDRESTTTRKSGEIDKTELKDGLSRLGIYLDILAVDELFEGIDTDNSGDIDIEEFLAFLEGCQPEEATIDEQELDLCKQIEEAKDERANIVIGSKPDSFQAAHMAKVAEEEKANAPYVHLTNSAGMMPGVNLSRPGPKGPLDGIKEVQALNETLSHLRQTLLKRVGRSSKGKATSDRVAQSKRLQFTQPGTFNLDMRIPRSARTGKRIPELMMRPFCDPRPGTPARRVRSFPWNYPDPDDETKRTVLLQATAGLPRAYLAKSVRSNVSVV